MNRIRRRMLGQEGKETIVSVTPEPYKPVEPLKRPRPLPPPPPPKVDPCVAAEKLRKERIDYFYSGRPDLDRLHDMDRQIAALQKECGEYVPTAVQPLPPSQILPFHATAPVREAVIPDSRPLTICDFTPVVEKITARFPDASGPEQVRAVGQLQSVYAGLEALKSDPYSAGDIGEIEALQVRIKDFLAESVTVVAECEPCKEARQAAKRMMQDYGGMAGFRRFMGAPRGLIRK